ncbi:MAG: trypsin-like peptidase domain-containing protein [Candidatus Poribacteria bacterium]|nr:trypsin-like peptidase domain-containing protein [Candidatus Poribacteria bacterium]
MKRKTNLKRDTIAYAVLILFAVTIAAEASPATQPDDLGILRSFENAISKIVDQSKPAVVSLTVRKEEQKDNKTIDTSGSGSGFIFRKDGYILTNEHVVRGAKSIRVRLFDGSTFDARMVGSDLNTDIAVIKIEREEGFPVLSLADSTKVRIGQFAIAIGHPIGYKYTVTAGIVGGKDRCFHPPKTKLFQYHNNYIQTDAWINKGSSGGPLLNIQGEVIGITTLNPGEGSSLAINSDLAKTIGNKLITHGRIIRGYIDADMQNVSQGIKITKVTPDTFAFQCGLERNDIIVEFDEEKVPGLYAFRLMVAECQIGKQYPIKVLRQKQEMTLNVTIDEMPLELVGRPANTKSVSWKTLGLVVRKLENGIFQRYTYLSEEDRGIIVEKVKNGSPGFKANIPRNALITAINGQEIVDVQTFETFLQGKQDGPNVTFDIKSIHGIEKVTVELNNN